jgi:hypothetical protein
MVPSEDIFWVALAGIDFLLFGFSDHTVMITLPFLYPFST